MECHRRAMRQRNIQTIVMLSQSCCFVVVIALSLRGLLNDYTPQCVVPEIFFCQTEGHLESKWREGSGVVIP